MFGLTLFLATALSITGFVVLGRMMIEWEIQRTRLAAVAAVRASRGRASTAAAR